MSRILRYAYPTIHLLWYGLNKFQRPSPLQLIRPAAASACVDDLPALRGLCGSVYFTQAVSQPPLGRTHNGPMRLFWTLRTVMQGTGVDDRGFLRLQLVSPPLLVVWARVWCSHDKVWV